MPKKFDPAVRERAVRMVAEHAAESGSVTRACVAVGAKLGISKETVRGWARQAKGMELARLRRRRKLR